MHNTLKNNVFHFKIVLGDFCSSVQCHTLSQAQTQFNVDLSKN